jgi:FMN-dependent NADH-azoreductase
MKQILHIISSPRGDRSYSKGLSSAIVRKLMDNKVAGKIIERNIAEKHPPLMDKILVEEFYKIAQHAPQHLNQVLAYANIIFEEIKAADIIVIGTPVYNLGISASLKAWIDQLIRIGVTYGYNREGRRAGYLKDKKVYLSVASGGVLSGNAFEKDFVETYIKETFFAYTGISDISVFRVEGTAQDNFTADYQKIISDL